jgi:hypothetical protein
MKLLRAIPITDAVLTASTIAASDYAAYNSGATYAAGDTVSVNVTGIHKNYLSLQNANTGHDPTLAANSSWWKDVGATNRWSMFDQSTGSQSSAADTFTQTFAPNAVAGTMALLNVAAANFRVIVTDPVDGVVADRTVYTALSPVYGDSLLSKTDYDVESSEGVVYW